MNSEALNKLPIEMQNRLAQIMAQGQAQVNAPAPAPAAPVAPQPSALTKPPSLMDHLIALRQEVAALRQETAASREEMVQLAQIIQANSGVVEGVGQAVGTIYQMFQQTSNQSPTYSQSFTEAPASAEDY